MPTNVYFNHAVKSEQDLHEDLVVESLRFYGHECFYLPRTIVDEDELFGEDTSSKFGDALFTCINKSVLPIISFKDLKPNSASISRTSEAMKVNKLTTLSGVPINFSLNFSS